jgi:hypothetical protein
MNMKDYSTLHLDINSSQGTACCKKRYGCKWTWKTIQHYTWTQIQVKEQLVVRKDMDVNEHERLFNITLRHKFKSRNSLL